jgi:hypothetical protein
MLTEHTRTAEEAFHVRQTQRYIDRTTDRLSDLIVELQRISSGLDRVPSPGRTSYSAVAADVHTAVAGWHMNTHIEQITLSAAEADMERVKARPVDPSEEFQRGFEEGDLFANAERDRAKGYTLRPEQAAALERYDPDFADRLENGAYRRDPVDRGLERRT